MGKGVPDLMMERQLMGEPPRPSMLTLKMRECSTKLVTGVSGFLNPIWECGYFHSF